MDLILSAGNKTLYLILLLSAAPVIVATLVGLIVGLFQTVTQLQEQTLAYTVKFVVIVITLFVTAALIGGTLYTYADRIFIDFPGLVQRG